MKKIEQVLKSGRKFLFQPFCKATPAVWLAIAVFIAVFIPWVIWQYNAFVYSGFDLAIFDQVLWNSSQGRFFAYSFDSQSYLVDHRAWALLLFVPLYWGISHPIILLVLQVVVVALGAVTAYMAAMAFLESSYVKKSTQLEKNAALIATLFAVVYLLHPIVQHMVVFEFHLLPFTIPLVFLLIRAVLLQKHLQLWMLSGALLLIRDDMALLIAGVGLYLLVTAIIDRSRKMSIQAVGVVLLGAVWFIAMSKIGAALAPSDSTKFFIFYEWMGSTPKEAVLFMLQHPWQTIMGALGRDHAITAITLLFMFSFLGLLRIRFLIPAVAVLTPYFLVSEDNLLSIVSSHYAAAAIPWLMIAALAGGVRVLQWIYRSKRFADWALSPGTLFFAITLAIFSVHVFVLSPVNLKMLYIEMHNEQLVEDLEKALALIPAEDSVMTTSKLYPRLSQREHLYTTQHVVAGTQHYSHLPYVAPDRVDWLVLEKGALLNYSQLFSAAERDEASERFGQIIQDNDLQLVMNTEYLLVYTSAGNQDKTYPVVSIDSFAQEEVETTIIGNIAIVEPAVETTGITVFMEAIAEPSELRTDYHMVVRWKDSEGVVLAERAMQIGGVDPTSSWSAGEAYEVYAPFTPIDTAVSVDVLIGEPHMQESDTILFVPVVWTISESNTAVFKSLTIE